MKLLVFSDSHGNETALFNTIRRYKKDVQTIFFCGDGHEDIETMQKRFSDKKFYIVRGNCDWCCDHPLLLTVTVAGKKILLTHGHAQRVKSGLEHLIMLGHQEQADIVLFGHTHQQLTTADSRMLICNPGSVGFNEEYTLIDIDEVTGCITATEYPNNQYGSVIIRPFP